MFRLFSLYDYRVYDCNLFLGLHCCPNGDICDVKGGTCKQSAKVWYLLVGAIGGTLKKYIIHKYCKIPQSLKIIIFLIQGQESVITMIEENSAEYSEILNGGPMRILLGTLNNTMALHINRYISFLLICYKSTITLSITIFYLTYREYFIK